MIQKILKNTFGYNQFRGEQEAIINNVIAKKDTLVIMPTGGGKSLCYQIPALVGTGISVIVSPLIALMNDQVAALKQLNVAAETLHSNISQDESNRIYKAIQENQLRLLYVSPEKLLTEDFQILLQGQKLDLFAVDEAHCVSVWGNDFRPEYVRLSKLKEAFPAVPLIALTATADGATQDDIIKQLNIPSCKKFLSSFERTNIRTDAKAGLKRMDQIKNFLLAHQYKPGIIYCLSRKNTETVAKSLQAAGYKAEAYHAGIDSDTRNRVQQHFQDDKIQIVCATIAFGMGIDKPNIRFVIHYNMPKNIESYYQEIGRAGRDGEPSEALLFYSWADYINLKRFIDESSANDTFKNVQRAKLERMWQFATTVSCRTNLVLNYFGEYRNTKCNHCDNCIHPPSFIDGTKYTQMALSGILRTGESVGINMLIDILRGSYKQELKAQGFDQLKTFGVGREIPFNHWRHFITQMINQGLVRLDFTDYSKLKTTPLSMDILKSKTQVDLTKFEAAPTKKAVVKKPSLDGIPVDENLFQALKSWRKASAEKQKVPAFVILHDKTLKQIASLKPATEPELLSVDGIGKAKLSKYGEEILAIAQKF